MPSRCARYGVETRSQPATSAPHACARSAYALIPAPPIPASQRRLPVGGCDLPDGASRARDDDVGRRKRRAEIVDEREQAIVGARDASAQLVVIALAAQMQHCGSLFPPGVHRRLVQGARSLAAAEYE